MKNEEIISAVSSINETIAERTTLVDEIYINFATNGTGQVVYLGGFQLWSSEDDTRRYDEATDSYEEIEMCLRRNIVELVARLNKITAVI